ncbi:MBL fold metallo-hydrolase [Propylenella binzhouense]|nr:MBL fold metallo-hydrolase [Propylenella binzhouense]
MADTTTGTTRERGWRPAEPPAFSARKVGEVVVTTIADGYRTFPLADGFVQNAGRDEINAALAEAAMPADEMTIVFNPVLLERAGQRILIDTGYGPAAGAQPGSTVGQTTKSLRAAGLAPEAIDLVIISHFHGDHINGLLDGDSNPVFPNAEIVVPEKEWAYWMESDAAETAGGPRIKENLDNARRVFGPLRERVARYAWDAEVAPGLTALGTPGHTPGHTSFRLESAGESLFIQSDVTNHPALFARHPGWHPAFDMDPQQAEATRRRVYDMLAAEKLMVQAFHYPFPCRARIEKAGDGYRPVALD